MPLPDHGLVLGPWLPALVEHRLFGIRAQSLMNHADQFPQPCGKARLCVP
jgi:hypothetical protein